MHSVAGSNLKSKISKLALVVTHHEKSCAEVFHNPYSKYRIFINKGDWHKEEDRGLEDQAMGGERDLPSSRNAHTINELV